MALTATADPTMATDITERLGRKNVTPPMMSCIYPFNRPNITLRVRLLASNFRFNDLGEVAYLIFASQDSGRQGILFAATKKQANMLGAYLGSRQGDRHSNDRELRVEVFHSEYVVARKERDRNVVLIGSSLLHTLQHGREDRSDAEVGKRRHRRHGGNFCVRAPRPHSLDVSAD